MKKYKFTGTHIIYDGIKLNVDFKPGTGKDMQPVPGIYAEIYWKEGHPYPVCFRESTNMEIRAKRHENWVKNGNLRSKKIGELAKKHGLDGYENFLVSKDKMLANGKLRRKCKALLRQWIQHPDYYLPT